MNSIKNFAGLVAIFLILTLAPAAVLAQTGSLTVTIDPSEAVVAGAQWRRAGTTTWLDSGVTETNVPVRTYMIEFKDVDLWQTPSFQLVTIESDQMASTNRSYLPGVGSLVIWGVDPDYGLLDVPEPNADFISSDGGSYHNLALKADGSVVAWGGNQTGQCDVPEPNSDFVTVAARGHKSAGLKSDGTVVTWGGFIADGEDDPPYDPPSAEENHDFVEISIGGSHSVGLRSDGSIHAWGDNYYEQCDVPEPNSDFMAVSAGSIHNMGLKADGTIVTWGNNDYEQCDVPEPNRDFVAIAAGGWHSVALKSDGSVVAWGWNEYEQCTLPESNMDFVKISAGEFHNVGLKSNGSVVTFGTLFQNIDVVPEPNSDFMAIDANHRITIGLKTSAQISVAIQPQAARDAGAQWSVDGGVIWYDSGMTIPKATGDYTVTYKDVSGWTTPADQSATLTTENATVTGTYVAISPTGDLTVTIEPQSACDAGAQWRLLGTETWLDSGATAAGLDAGDYTIEFKTLDGWVTPDAQSVTVLTGQTASITARLSSLSAVSSWVEYP